MIQGCYVEPQKLFRTLATKGTEKALPQKAQEQKIVRLNAIIRLCFLCLKLFLCLLWLPRQSGEAGGGGDGVEAEFAAGQLQSEVFSL
jgi:hypothetical protein